MKPVADEDTRIALEQHWAASEAGDYDVEHGIYQEDAVLHYPQSGEAIHGRAAIQESRAGNPAKRHFVVDRILGSGDLWVTQYVITYDGKPTYTVSIMQLRDGKVQRETQYFGDPFAPPAWRAALGSREM